MATVGAGPVGCVGVASVGVVKSAGAGVAGRSMGVIAIGRLSGPLEHAVSKNEAATTKQRTVIESR